MTELLDVDLEVLTALEELGGQASPGELSEWTGHIPRTISRSLGRLEEAGNLAERTKRRVRLAAIALPAPEPVSAPTAEHGRERLVFRARVRPALTPETRADVDAPAVEPDGGGFWRGLREGLGT